MANTKLTGIRSMDFPIIDKVFAMEGGFVLNFSNRTFGEFFRDELNVDIDDPRWSVQGESKAKRLRYYLRQVDQSAALNTLNALWEYREVLAATQEYPELDDSVRVAFFKIIERLGGKSQPTETVATAPIEPLIDPEVASALAILLLDVSNMEPQKRGYAFENFLKDLFDAYGLSARASFRLVGEQIDGSFVLGHDTYLLEAKWTSALVGADTLRAFNAKVEDKAKWSRGLVVSVSGFTSEGLSAFGRGKSVVCMDGLDLHEVLTGRLDFAIVLAAKVRQAAETGKPFVRVRDLALATKA